MTITIEDTEDDLREARLREMERAVIKAATTYRKASLQLEKAVAALIAARTESSTPSTTTS